MPTVATRRSARKDAGGHAAAGGKEAPGADGGGGEEASATEEAVRAMVERTLRATPTPGWFQKIIDDAVDARLAALGLRAQAVEADARYRMHARTTIRENLYAPSKEQSELSSESGAPFAVAVTRLDGSPAPELEGLEVQATLLQNNPYPGNADQGLVPALAREGHKHKILEGTTVTKVRGGQAVFAAPDGRDAIRVTDNSSKFPGGTFVLEVRALVGTASGPGASLVEGEVEVLHTVPFRVKSSRARDNEKKGADIQMKDPVFRLKNICKNGELDRRLKDLGIITVGDFISRATANEAGVRTALGKGMSDALWKDTWGHALMAVESQNPDLPTRISNKRSGAAKAPAPRSLPPPDSSLYAAPQGPAGTSAAHAPAPAPTHGVASADAMSMPPPPTKQEAWGAPGKSGLARGNTMEVTPSRAPSFDFEGFFTSLASNPTLSRGNSLVRVPSGSLPVPIGAVHPGDSAALGGGLNAGPLMPGASAALLPGNSSALLPGISNLFAAPSLQEPRPSAKKRELGS